MKTDRENRKRRNFLLGATVGSAGAVAAVVSGGNVKQIAELAKSADAKQKGYHETDHIRQYYDTTRI
jgi:hypothetical protein